MKQASLIIGIIAIIGMLIGLVPCLGWFNWLNLPLAAVGIVLGFMAYNEQRNMPLQQDFNNVPYRNNSLPIGLILNGVAFGFGLIRLVIGGGIF